MDSDKEVSASQEPRVTPPEKFDPMKASNSDLVKYGYPPRPNKSQLPKLRALWERTISRGFHLVVPEPDPHSTVHLMFQKLIAGDVRRNTSTDRWAGAGIDPPPPGQTFSTITGRWTVPYVDPDSQQNSVYSVCAWISLGSSATDTSGNPYSVGIVTMSWCVVNNGTIVPNGQAAYPFYFWPDSGKLEPIAVQIEPGQQVSGTICTKTGMLYFANNTTNVGTSITIDTLPLFQGNSAVWIVGDFLNGIRGVISNSTIFKNCIAIGVDSNGVSHENDLKSAKFLNWVDPVIGVNVIANDVDSTTFVIYQ